MTGLFTIDSLIAVIIGFSLLSTAMYLLAEPKGDDMAVLQETAQDILAIAEENGALDGAAGGFGGGLDDVLALAGENVCFSMAVRNSTNDLVYSDGHECDYTKDTAVARRSFVADKRFYIAEVRMVHK